MVNLFQVIVPLADLLKTPEKQRFRLSGVFKGYRSGKLA